MTEAGVGGPKQPEQPARPTQTEEQLRLVGDVEELSLIHI